jgi:hypothetical protein
MTERWSKEETDNPVYAVPRGFFKVEQWIAALGFCPCPRSCRSKSACIASNRRANIQLRPLDIIPITTPTSSAPAIVPSGLRRAIASNSDAKVLAWVVAEVANSEPLSANPLAAVRACAATVSPMSRIALVAPLARDLKPPMSSDDSELIRLLLVA